MYKKIRRVCVFCGSGKGSIPEYLASAKELGRLLASEKIGLVYGGAKVGTMGAIASSVVENGGEVIGVIPRSLVDKEVAYTELADLRIVSSMHERKALMADLSDGFIAMPGGLGTIEEIFEALTWAQLGIHSKPCGLLNICHFYDRLIDFLDFTVEQQFIRIENREMILIDENPKQLLDQFEAYQPPLIDKAKWALELLAQVK